MAKQPKPKETGTPSFGITCPASSGTIGTTAVVAYGWCQDVTAATHRIECIVTKTNGTSHVYATTYATFYCGDPPTLWKVEIPTTSPALVTGDTVVFSAELQLTGGTSVQGPITRTDLDADEYATTPTPTFCTIEIPIDPELDLDAPPFPAPLRAAAAPAGRRFKREQAVSFSFRPRRRVHSAQAILARVNANNKVVKVLAVIPAELRASTVQGPDQCQVIVPLPKDDNPASHQQYVVEVVLLNPDGIRVGPSHREVLGHSPR